MISKGRKRRLSDKNGGPVLPELQKEWVSWGVATIIAQEISTNFEVLSEKAINYSKNYLYKDLLLYLCTKNQTIH